MFKIFFTFFFSIFLVSCWVGQENWEAQLADMTWIPEENNEIHQQKSVQEENTDIFWIELDDTTYAYSWSILITWMNVPENNDSDELDIYAFTKLMTKSSVGDEYIASVEDGIRISRENNEYIWDIPEEALSEYHPAQEYFFQTYIEAQFKNKNRYCAINENKDCRPTQEDIELLNSFRGEAISNTFNISD